MGKKLYVGNLAYSTTEDDLRDTFAKIGEVASAKLIIDPTNGRSKGFGFVEMATDEDAEKAISTMNGSSFMDRTQMAKFRNRSPSWLFSRTLRTWSNPPASSSCILFRYVHGSVPEGSCTPRGLARRKILHCSSIAGSIFSIRYMRL